MADHISDDRLAAKAFRHVLGRKQTNYQEVIAWLDVALEQVAPLKPSRLNRIAKQGEAVFRGYKF